MPTDGLIARILHHRDRAEARGDAGVVKECDWNLTRLGYRPDKPELAEARAEADVRPVRSPTARRDA